MWASGVPGAWGGCEALGSAGAEAARGVRAWDASRGAGVGIRRAGGLGRRLAPAFSVRVAAPSCSRSAWRSPRCQNERVLRRFSALSGCLGCGRFITCQFRGLSPAIILIRGPAKLVRFDSGRGSAANATVPRRLAAPTATATPPPTANATAAPRRRTRLLRGPQRQGDLLFSPSCVWRIGPFPRRNKVALSYFDILAYRRSKKRG